MQKYVINKYSYLLFFSNFLLTINLLLLSMDFV